MLMIFTIQLLNINDAIKPISIRETEFITEQMKTCVCKIHLGQKKGTPHPPGSALRGN